MKPHINEILVQGMRHNQKLHCVAHSCFDTSQVSSRNMYVAHIRGVFDYGVPICFPIMSRTNLDRLQCLWNKDLCKLLWVPSTTRILDLHLGANVIPPTANATPLTARYEAATAYQAEIYRRHPVEDPLNSFTHAIPLNRLKRMTWKDISDGILEKAGINLSHGPSTESSTTIHPMYYVLDENEDFVPIIEQIPVSIEHVGPSFLQMIPLVAVCRPVKGTIYYGPKSIVLSHKSQIIPIPSYVDAFC